MIDTTFGNYKLTGIIGSGGMGAVYYGEDISLKRPVAIKTARPEILDHPHALERFQTEAITMAKLNHPNIATVFGLIKHADALLLVMEYVKGWTLSQVLDVRQALPPGQAIMVLRSALAGIGYAHRQGIIHRDLKPTNLMLNESGLVKIMDFGIARVINGPEYTQTGQLIGTVKYMPPEQIRGDRLDSRTDIYVLGLVLYRLLTGKAPFTAKSDYQIMKAQVETAPPPPRQFSAQISDALQQVVLKALSKAMQDRFASAAEFSKALNQCPEIHNPPGEDLEQLVTLMQQQRPVTVTPLNQQNSAALQTEGTLALTHKLPSFKIPAAATRIIHPAIATIGQLLERSAKSDRRRILIISLLVVICCTVMFLFLSGDPADVNLNSTHTDKIIHPTPTGDDEDTDIQGGDTTPAKRSDQQEQRKWIIER